MVFLFKNMRNRTLPRPSDGGAEFYILLANRDCLSLFELLFLIG